MKKIKGFHITVLTLVLALSLIALSPSALAAKGPRNPDLLIKYYSGIEEAYMALKLSEIDIVG
ncbi:hypothetical protein KAU25_04580, partial [Candidatus Bathyarchaeota archaeon]|nr:hypothetical protein [Candidatus Bathyarchaeota archaeon]